MSSLSARLEVSDDQGRPTRAFVQAWTSSGALVGLPGGLRLVDAAGAATRDFLAVIKAAFPGCDIRPSDRLIVARRPTRRFLALWASSTA